MSHIKRESGTTKLLANQVVAIIQDPQEAVIAAFLDKMQVSHAALLFQMSQVGGLLARTNKLFYHYGSRFSEARSVLDVSRLRGLNQDGVYLLNATELTALDNALNALEKLYRVCSVKQVQSALESAKNMESPYSGVRSGSKMPDAA